MFASLCAMLCGLHSLFRGQQRLDRYSAAISIALVVYAVGNTAISWWNSDPLSNFEPYLPFLGAPLLAVGMRACALRPFHLGAAFAVSAALAALGSAAQVFAAQEVHRAEFLVVGTTFGALGVIYGVLCASMLGWAANSPWQKTVLASGMIGGACISLLNGSKGSWIPLLVVGPFALWAGMAKTSWKLKAAVCCVLLAATVAAVSLPNSPVIPRFKELISEGYRLRSAFWRESVELFKQQPLIGVGRAKVKERLNIAWLGVRPYAPHERPPGHAHNEFIDTMAARGSLGLLLDLAALAVPALAFWRLRKTGAVPGAATTGLLFLGAFVLCGMTDVLFQLMARRMIFLFCVAYCTVAATGGSDNH